MLNHKNPAREVPVYHMPFKKGNLLSDFVGHTASCRNK